MQRPFPPQAAAPLTLMQSSQPPGRRPPHEAQPRLIWLTDPGSTIEMALASRRLHSSDGEIVVVVAGEIDAASAPRLSAFIDGVYFPHEGVRLDLGSTAFADGALLRVLDTERARRAPHQVGIEIIRASPAVRRVLETAGHLRYLSRT